MESMEANIPGKEDAEKKFKEHWTNKSNAWISMIYNSDLGIDTKIELKNTIEVSFLKHYVNNKDRGSVQIFIQPLIGDLYLEKEYVSKEDEKRDEIVKYIINDLSPRETNPRQN